MTDNNLTEVNEYKSWGAGTLLATKRELTFIVHSPDPWDFQSTNFKEVGIKKSEKFILMLPATKEEYQGRHYLLFKILHPVFGKMTAAFLENEFLDDRIQKSFRRADADED